MLISETDTEHHASLTSGRVLVRNSLCNLAGHAVPLVVAFFAIPVLIKGLGTERFGVLTLIWMAVGYFCLFDMGIGRATTKVLAEQIARNKTDALSSLVWTSLGMLISFGFAGALLMAALTPLLVSDLFHIPGYLQDETRKACYLIAVSLPLVLGTAGIRGALEAQQRFGLITMIKIPVSAAFFIGPLVLAVSFSNSLYPITVALLGTRLIEFSVYLFFCFRTIPELKQFHWPNRTNAEKLLGFGGWLTITNIVGPLMTYMDRFIIGGIVSMTAVAYYATPYDFVARLAIIPGSILGVMFPALTASFTTDIKRFTFLYDKTVIYIVCLMVPVALTLTMGAHRFLAVWLGNEFAAQSTPVLQIFAVGALINAVGQVPFSTIQAMGRPDLTAKLHMFELPLYLGMILFFTLNMGITGAALAWLFRVVLDTAVLSRLAHQMMRHR